jgi:hypothetical protein
MATVSFPARCAVAVVCGEHLVSQVYPAAVPVEVFLDDVFIPDDDGTEETMAKGGILGDVHGGWGVAMATATSERGLTLRSPGGPAARNGRARRAGRITTAAGLPARQRGDPMRPLRARRGLAGMWGGRTGGPLHAGIIRRFRGGSLALAGR